MWVLHTAKLWGWQDESMDCKKRMKIARAACQQVAYNFCYAMPFSASRLSAWDNLMRTQVDDSMTQDEASSPKHGGRKKYTDIIEGL